MRNIFIVLLIIGGSQQLAAQGSLMVDPGSDCQNFYCHDNGGVSIGTPVLPIGYKFSVAGKGIMEGLKIRYHSKWPDYVFNKDYTLMPIPRLKDFIISNGHLPGIPPAKNLEQDGIDVGEINALLLKKIEEMTLYLILVQKELNSMETKGSHLDGIQAAKKDSSKKSVTESNGNNPNKSLEPNEQNISENSLCQNIYCNSTGGISIGTQVVPSDYKFALGGKAIMEGLKIELQSRWPDYVFENAYKLMPLSELKTYIESNGHLPNIPTANLVKKDGVDIEYINAQLLLKLEEMSLYLIDIEERFRKVKEDENN